MFDLIFGIMGVAVFALLAGYAINLLFNWFLSALVK